MHSSLHLKVDNELDNYLLLEIGELIRIGWNFASMKMANASYLERGIGYIVYLSGSSDT